MAPHVDSRKGGIRICQIRRHWLTNADAASSLYPRPTALYPELETDSKPEAPNPNP